MATQPFRNGGDFEGDVTFSTSPTVPSKSTPAGDNPTVLATEAQVFNNSRTLQDVTTSGNTTSDSIIINANYLGFKPSISEEHGSFWFGFNNLSESSDYDYWNFKRGAGNETTHSFKFIDNHDQIYIFPLAPSGEGSIDVHLASEDYVNKQMEIYLKSLPTYNASTPQVLGHDASGNIQWQTP